MSNEKKIELIYNQIDDLKFNKSQLNEVAISNNKWFGNWNKLNEKTKVFISEAELISKYIPGIDASSPNSANKPWNVFAFFVCNAFVSGDVSNVYMYICMEVCMKVCMGVCIEVCMEVCMYVCI